MSPLRQIEENVAIWRSKGQQFLKIMTSAQGVRRPQTVKITQVHLQCQVMFRYVETRNVATGSRRLVVTAQH